eukprot:c11308_g1_i1.p1 GENE.c11308_g1_i1~~c11308_g1_i1.p1  ORF type:complete len:190 (-),score=35.87 c11308_g1_i1:39-575(-)
MMSMATNVKRIHKEWREWNEDPISGITIELTDCLFHWTGKIEGPIDSPYAGGVFDVDILFPAEYPFKPPRIKFETKVYHPNINKNGGICLDILRDEWSPILTIAKALLSVASLLCDANPEDPLMPEIAKQFANDRPAFEATAREWTQMYAIPQAKMEEDPDEPPHSNDESDQTEQTAN